MKKKFQIFISSTYLDLKEERQEVVQAILENHHIPAGMELFTAQNTDQWKVIKKWIDESDIIILLIGCRYGSIDSATSKSYTQMEYEYSIKKNKPIIVLNFSDIYLKKNKTQYLEENNKNLDEFRNIVLQKLVKFVDDFSEIKSTVINAISELERNDDIFISGWVRGDIEKIPSSIKIGQFSYRELKEVLVNKKMDVSFIEGGTSDLSAFIIYKQLIVGSGGEFNSSSNANEITYKIYYNILPYFISLGLLEICNVPKVYYKKTRFTKDGIKFNQMIDKMKLYEK